MPPIELYLLLGCPILENITTILKKRTDCLNDCKTVIQFEIWRMQGNT